MDYRIISIGTLSTHELWERTAPPRTPHATTTLIRSGEKVILVDPGLPPQAIAARLTERSGLSPNDVTDVFLTTFRPAHRAGLAAFAHCNWLIFEREREAVGRYLVEQFQNAPDDEVREHIKKDIETLQRFKNAPDKPADNVDLFPCPGYTPGSCGLLLTTPNRTTLVAGDCVATEEHLNKGRVLKGAYDAELAVESLKEAIEIADVIVPGHDNVVLNKTRGGYGF